jgi:hypothetical protein
MDWKPANAGNDARIFLVTKSGDLRDNPAWQSGNIWVR